MDTAAKASFEDGPVGRAVRRPALRKAVKWTAVVVTGLFGVVMLGGGKIQSGTLLVLAAFAMAVSRRHRVPLWLRAGLLVVLYGLVAWNISTTDLPGPVGPGMMSCEEHSEWYSPTGVRFVDQVMWIVSGFTAQAAPS